MTPLDTLVEGNAPPALGVIALGLFGMAWLWGRRRNRGRKRNGPLGGHVGWRAQAILFAVVCVLSLLGGVLVAGSQGRLPDHGKTGKPAVAEAQP